MKAAGKVIVSRSVWRLVVGTWMIWLAGCAVSQTGTRSDSQILEMQKYLNSWSGEYRGRVDYGRWYLSTGPTRDWIPPSHNSNTDGWQWEKELWVDLTIRFIPNEVGGRLQLTLSLVDTTQALSWNLNTDTTIGNLDHQAMDVPKFGFGLDFEVPRMISLLDDHRLAGTWGADHRPSSLDTSVWSTESRGEFTFERKSGEIIGTLKFHSKEERTGEYRYEKKHELLLKHLRRKEKS